jgi:hypothetical protein
MKSNFLKSLVLENKQRCGVALLLFVCLGLFALAGAAQLRNQRRVTALQLGEAAGGSRVTIVSDSALNDYEAFRRGDRFYVKIPLADFASAVPHLRANGFEDVQVQKSGDSVIVSFKLQPGATARVDQRGNRLDVIFSSPIRNLANATNAGSSRTTSGSGNSQTSVDRGRDAAGPLPPGSLPNSRDRLVTERPVNRDEARAPQNPWVPTSQGNVNKNSRKVANSPSPNANVAVKSPSPVSSPASSMNSATSSYSPPPTVSPAASPATRPAISSGPVGAAGGGMNWNQRSVAIRQWMAANRLATLLGALILLSLILYLVLAFRNRKKDEDQTKRAKAPKVQPKYSPDGELNELPSPAVKEQTTRPIKNEPAIAQAGSKVSPARSPVQEQPNSRGQQPATAPAAASATNHQWILTKPTIASPTAGHDELSSEEEEREVFEL